jgi:molybdate transport system substrate-binding protein
MRRKILSCCWIVLASICWLPVAATARSAAQEITVAAAADLQFVLPEVAARFEKQTGRHVKLVFGSSGNFFAQIQNGAPFDLFFSADIDYAKNLESAGLAEPGSLSEYATGKIVLWLPNDSKFDPQRGLDLLLDPGVRKIAIANPQHAPYGRAAVAALQHQGLYDRVKDKLVLGENISQAVSFVVAGSADAGIVAMSLALAPSLKDKGKYAEVPSDEYPAIQQAAVVLKSSKQKATAQSFLTYATSASVSDLWKTYGFIVPHGAPR